MTLAVPLKIQFWKRPTIDLPPDVACSPWDHHGGMALTQGKVSAIYRDAGGISLAGQWRASLLRYIVSSSFPLGLAIPLTPRIEKIELSEIERLVIAPPKQKYLSNWHVHHLFQRTGDNELTVHTFRAVARKPTRELLAALIPADRIEDRADPAPCDYELLPGLHDGMELSNLGPVLLFSFLSTAPPGVEFYFSTCVGAFEEHLAELVKICAPRGVRIGAYPDATQEETVALWHRGSRLTEDKVGLLGPRPKSILRMLESNGL